MPTRSTYTILSLLLMATFVSACEVRRGAAEAEGGTVEDTPQEMEVLEYLNPEGANMENASFSDAVRIGNVLFLTGKLGTVPGEGLVEGGIEAETAQTLENIKTTLERYGSSMDQVAKCTVFLIDFAEWGAMNRVYREYFTNPPARSAVGVSGLALNARVEIECIAAVL